MAQRAINFYFTQAVKNEKRGFFQLTHKTRCKKADCQGQIIRLCLEQGSFESCSFAWIFFAVIFRQIICLNYASPGKVSFQIYFYRTVRTTSVGCVMELSLFTRAHNNIPRFVSRHVNTVPVEENLSLLPEQFTLKVKRIAFFFIFC